MQGLSSVVTQAVDRREIARVLIEAIVVCGDAGLLWPEFQEAWDCRRVVPLRQPKQRSGVVRGR